ncbi:MAG: hypothetical protein IE919_19635 [Thioclava sp.]|nr:hypothetical protein [Thioclava sp.]MBD3805421.1 hypothetical protein [Thioclava sp.]
MKRPFLHGFSRDMANESEAVIEISEDFEDAFSALYAPQEAAQRRAAAYAARELRKREELRQDERSA